MCGSQTSLKHLHHPQTYAEDYNTGADTALTIHSRICAVPHFFLSVLSAGHRHNTRTFKFQQTQHWPSKLKNEMRLTLQTHSDEEGVIIFPFSRVAEVGRLSPNAKNAFNSFVGHVFGILRQKALFLSTLPNS